MKRHRAGKAGGGYLSRWFHACVGGAVKYVPYKIAEIPSHTIRNLCYRYVLGINIGPKVTIYKGTVFRGGGAYKCSIGKGSVIGDDNMLDARGGLQIGENCNFSTGVRIWTAQHDVQAIDFCSTSGSVVIEDRCWISGNTTILPGVTVGEGCVVASGAVVTKDCEPFGIYAGVPARRIGERNRAINYQFDGRHGWFL